MEIVNSLTVCQAFESLEKRESRVFRTSVDVGDKTRGECRWRLFRVSGGDDTTRSCSCGGRRGRRGGWRSAPVVGPRCQPVSTPWNLDTGSNKPRGTSISYIWPIRRTVAGTVRRHVRFLVCLVPPSNPARAIKHSQDTKQSQIIAAWQILSTLTMCGTLKSLIF